MSWQYSQRDVSTTGGTDGLGRGGAVSSRNICYMRDVELHEHLLAAFAFHPRSVGSDVFGVFLPDGDNNGGISPYNEALAARSNSPSQA